MNYFLNQDDYIDIQCVKKKQTVIFAKFKLSLEPN